MTLHTDLADYLTRQKITLKMTFAKLSIETGFSLTYLKTIFSGKYIPTHRETLNLLAKALKTDYSTIVNLSVQDRSNRLKAKLLKEKIKKT